MKNVYTLFMLNFSGVRDEFSNFLCFSIILPVLEVSLGDEQGNHSFLHLFFPTVLSIEFESEGWIVEFALFGFGLSFLRHLESVE